MQDAKCKVKANEEDAKELVNTETLAGHFMRGHSGSLAYYLSMEHGASWGPMLGIDRARHTLPSFFASYARGVCLPLVRLITKFDAHPKKSELRFESAARL